MKSEVEMTRPRGGKEVRIMPERKCNLQGVQFRQIELRERLLSFLAVQRWLLWLWLRVFRPVCFYSMGLRLAKSVNSLGILCLFRICRVATWFQRNANVNISFLLAATYSYEYKFAKKAVQKVHLDWTIK